MGAVYAVANQKGGVGKTTTAVNLAACVAASGRQVLLVDLDQQCNATVGLGLERDLRPSTYDCLVGAASLAAAARPAGPPQPLIVPVQAEYLALEGLVEFLRTLELIRREVNPALVLTGVVITMHDERTRLASDVEGELRSHLPELVFKTVIPRSVRVAEAPSFGVPVIAHAPASRGSNAYRDLAAGLAAREEAEHVAVSQPASGEHRVGAVADGRPAGAECKAKAQLESEGGG